ncbi:MAG: radical SAM protein [Cyanobacteria bacterium P01_A01_bin.135]
MTLDDRSSELEEYWSCDYLENGLSFSYFSIRSCAIVHHGTGEPTLLAYRGGDICFDDVITARRDIVSQNQTATHHPNCKGCPNLVKRPWPQANYPVRWLGITAWLGCNLKCRYCWLEWADWSPRKTRAKLKSYDVYRSVRQLIEKQYLAPDAVIDWGGGGEPSLMPEFNQTLRLLSDHGTTQWVHTNATQTPTFLKEGAVEASRIHVLCSVDAGSPSVYQQLKGYDLYNTVWQNLRTYILAGAVVTVKYIMLPENCSRQEIRRFVRRAIASGRPTILGDFDYRFPEPTSDILDGLAYLQLLADKYGLAYSFEGVGRNSFAGGDLKAAVEAHFPNVYHDAYLYPLRILSKAPQTGYRLSILSSLLIQRGREKLGLLFGYLLKFAR